MSLNFAIESWANLNFDLFISPLLSKHVPITARTEATHLHGKGTVINYIFFFSLPEKGDY